MDFARVSAQFLKPFRKLPTRLPEEERNDDGSSAKFPEEERNDDSFCAEVVVVVGKK